MHLLNKFCRCRENFADLYEFCEEVIDIAKQFILPPRNLEERIGGLFLLYGLYNKVPIEKLVKINVTMSEWTDIMDLHNEIQQNEIFDANYILSKMICDDAFVHSFLGKEVHNTTLHLFENLGVNIIYIFSDGSGKKTQSQEQNF